jgi:hypothetical protein
MRFIAVTAVVMSVSFQALYATTYAPPTRIQVSAAKSDYILELIPGERDGRFSPEDSKAICYDSLVTDNTRLFVRKIWEVSGWYSWGCMLSDDGRRVAQIGQVSTMSGGISVLRCVRFWMDGKLVGSFTCYDLVSNLDEFPAAGPFGGGDWILYDPKEIAPQFVADEKFRFATIDGRTHIFDFKASKIESTAGQGGAGHPATAPEPEAKE